MTVNDCHASRFVKMCIRPAALKRPQRGRKAYFQFCNSAHTMKSSTSFGEIGVASVLLS